MANRILAIGDVHGCFTSLKNLIDLVEPDETDQLIFLGDYIDRGESSRRVMDYLIELNATYNCRFIMGNHEEMFLSYLKDKEQHMSWLKFGGFETLQSYQSIMDVSHEHLMFIVDMVDYVELDNYIFVHGSYDPQLDMALQNKTFLRWTRCYDNIPHKSGKMVICGHSPQFDGDPLDLGHTICIDTAACYGGCLTCMDVENRIYYQTNEHHENRVLTEIEENEDALVEKI